MSAISDEFLAVAIPKLAVTNRCGQCCDSMAAHSASAIWTAVCAFDAGQQDDEFLAAEPHHQVARAGVGRQGGGDHPEDVVAGQVAELVVVRFEIVNVDRQHRERHANFGSRSDGVDTLGQPSAVGKTGQRVEICHLLEANVLLLQLGLDVKDTAGDRQPDDQLFLIHGLGQEVVGAGRQALQSVEAIGPTRHHDDVRVRVPLDRSDPAAKLRTVHIGHHPVRDHHPPIPAIDELKSSDARGDQMGLMAEMGERSGKRHSDSFLIVDDEYSHGLLFRTRTGFSRTRSFWRSILSCTNPRWRISTRRAARNPSSQRLPVNLKPARRVPKSFSKICCGRLSVRDMRSTAPPGIRLNRSAA